MNDLIFPPLVFSEWKETRDTLKKYSKMVASIREKMSLYHPYNWHTALELCGRGFTTAPMLRNQFSPAQVFEVILNLDEQTLIIESTFREVKKILLSGQSLNALCDETCSLLTDIGVKPPMDKIDFADGKPGRFIKEHVTIYWEAAKKFNSILMGFKSELKQELSPVLFLPESLSVILSCMPGKPAAKEFSLGFSAGDETFGDTFFYVSLPGSEEHEKSVFPYNELINLPEPENRLISFFKSALTEETEMT